MLFALFGCIFFNQSQAQYATTGTGVLRNQIWWFDWNGFSINNNQSKVFFTDDGLKVTITFSAVLNPPSPSLMNTWNGAVLHTLYNFSPSSTVRPALYRNGDTVTTNFTMNITATRQNVPVPFTFVAADAEASINEITSFTTDGTNWQMLDFFRNSNQTTSPINGCNTQSVNIIQTYGYGFQMGQNPVVSTSSSTGSLIVSTIMNKLQNIGGMAVAFGIFSPIDRGDLPISYSVAHHKINYTNVNGCVMTPGMPGIVQVSNLFIGATSPDPDIVQTLDDNADGVDEDGISSFPQYNFSGVYNLTVPVTNSTGSTAYLTGWFDYNRDGTFGVGESATATISNGANSAILTWSGLPIRLPSVAVGDFAFRFRLASNLAETQLASGFANNGEVEDYLVTGDSLQPPCPQECFWTLGGNVTDPNNFIGTKNENEFRIRTNNVQRAVIDNQGNVGFATTLPTAKFHTVGTVRHENLPAGNGYYLVIDEEGNVYRSDCFNKCMTLEKNSTPTCKDEVEILSKKIAELEARIDKLTNKGFGADQDGMRLVSCVPNPFTSSTRLSYYIPNSFVNVSLNIYTVDGKLLQSLPVSGNGYGSIEYKTSVNSSGTLFAILENDKGEKSSALKMIISK